MKDEVKALYLAVLVSLVAIFVTNYFMPKKAPVLPEVAVSEEVELKAETPADEKTIVVDEAALDAETVLKQDRRVKISTPALTGSIRVKGGRFDDLYLDKYKQTLAEDSSDVELFSPAKTDNPYYAEFGWIAASPNTRVPDSSTVWTVKGTELTPQTPLVMEWNNGQGLKFIRKISVDDNYMFNIDQAVENNSGAKVTLYPYGLIKRVYDVKNVQSSVVHEGMIGVVDSNLKEIKYKKLEDKESQSFKTDGGWAGFSDRYWFSALILDKNVENKVKFSNTGNGGYQVDYVGAPVSIEAGSLGSSSGKMFAGAKEIKLLDRYTKQFNIDKFDLAVDFGWYYFLTKPFFYILDFLYHIIGNMGWAILLFAALLRLAMYPIAGKSFESMSKMKKVQPKIKELQERYGEDKMKLQQEMMNLYRKEKINPAAGCLPMLIQIPVFFSLYKVLNISIEIRHAPFIGWIKDLSAPDPLTLSTIFHFPVPGLLDIGVWPIIMGLTMFIQQKLNPAPANKDQARMFMMLPIIFTFMLGHFASGLVIYWSLSNILSILQQKAIMRKNGVK